MFPRIIFQTWKTHHLPEPFNTWAESWKKHNPRYAYILFDDYDNRDFVKRKFPQFLSVYDSFHAEIYRVDFVRYLFLYEYGGIYADLDFECLRPFDSLLAGKKDYDIILGRVDPYDHYYLPNALMISKPRCQFWMDIANYISSLDIPKEAPHSSEFRKSPDHMTGSVVLQKIYEESSTDKIYIAPTEVFYPMTYVTVKRHKQCKKLYSKINKKIAEDQGSYAITYWTNTWTSSWYNNESQTTTKDV
jgi:mannosyltransferase OCH1-like enzyme